MICLDIIDSSIPVPNINKSIIYKYDKNYPVNINSNIITVNILLIDSINTFSISINNNFIIRDFINHLEINYFNNLKICKIYYYGIELNNDSSLLLENIENNSTILVVFENDYIEDISSYDIEEVTIENLYISSEEYESDENEDYYQYFLENTNIMEIEEINNKYPVINYNENNSNVCIICFEELLINDNIRKTDCNHMFHRNCIDKWLTEYNNYCPVCKKNL